MSNVISYTPFHLKKDVVVFDFLAVSDEFQENFLSKQQGYISRQLLRNEEAWVDLVTWESMADVDEAKKVFFNSLSTSKYRSFIEWADGGFASNCFAVVKEFL